MIIIFN